MTITATIGSPEADMASTSTAASAIPGKDMTTSSTRMTTSPIHLRLVAAMAPRTAARARAMPVALKPTTRETRAP